MNVFRINLSIVQWWILFSVLSVLIQLVTIGYLPQFSQDEVQITDYGRLALDPASDWGATWLLQQERPLTLWTYLGPISSELGYQFISNSGFGPRVVALIGGVFAATLMLCWLIQRHVPKYAALALSLGFLLDPFFILSQRPARVDCWVIGFLLAACYLLRRAASSTKRVAYIQVAAAGAMVTIATLIWPSALFLYSLVCLEFLFLIYQKKQKNSSIHTILLSILYFLCGAAGMLIILLLPVWNGLKPLFDDLFNVVSLNVKSNQTVIDRFLQLFEYDLWLKQLKAFIKTLSPFLPLFALVGAIYRKDTLLIAATLIASSLIVATLVYEFRVLYLMPYLVALFGGIYEKFEIKASSLFLRRMGGIALIVFVAWSSGITLLVRSFIALKEKDNLSTEKLQYVAKAGVGPGNYKVFMANTYELYYVGRSIGWKIYNLYPLWDYNTAGSWMQKDLYKPTEKFITLLSNMDYAIFMDNSISKEVEEGIAKSGMHFHKRIQVNRSDKSPTQFAFNNRTWNIMIGYLRGSKQYGSYIVFKRNL